MNELIQVSWEPCPKCRGAGFSFKQVTVDTRLQVRCPDCGGSGRFTDALASKLSGETYETNLTHPIQYYDTKAHS